MRIVLILALGLSLSSLAPGLTGVASAASPLNVSVGYFDTHTVPFSSNQPNPWPYKDPSSFVGTPCPNYPNDTTCWDTSALRLDNPGSTDVTGVSASVVIGTKTYALWGSNLTVKAGGMLVLTETGTSQNSENFDGSDYPPNSYNGGNTASCVNSGAIPMVKITVAGTTTTYLDNGQVLNGQGVDNGHCLNGKFVSGRMDESHPWVQIGASSAVAPSAPQSLAAKAGDGSVSLTWTAPASNGGAAVSSYNIYRGTSAGGEGGTAVGTVSGTTLSFTDTGLTNGTTYYYTVKAVNSAGTSAASNEASATPAAVTATVPTAPQSPAATGGNGSVSLSWSAPSSNGGSPITSYNVYRSTTPGGEGSTPLRTNVTGTTFNDLTVTNGTKYYYTVAAVNAVGTSPQSNEANATPQATVPSAPTGLVASAGDGKVMLSWTVPNLDGGSPITGYNVYRSTTPGGEGSTPYATAVSSTYTDSAATNGTKYYYTVAAVNAVGTGPQSGEANATPQAAATVPSAPQGLTATGSNQAVQLSWSAPASNGGATVTSYNVYRSTTAGGEGSTPVATGVTGTSYTDNPLTNGTTYYYTVAAVNAVGTGPQSTEANAAPKAGAPTAPLGLTASAGNGSVSLSWSAPTSNGGSAITGYNVYRGTSPGGEATTPVTTGVTGTSFTDTGLANGTTYYYKVAAVNSAGTSPPSNEASATPQVPSAAAYVGRVGSATASSSRTTISVPVGASGVAAGHTLVVSLLLSSTTHLTTAVSATDSAGNSYAVGRDTNDGSSGDRTVVLVSVGVKALAAGGSITLTYPSSAETHVSVDEFSGITGIDTSAGATGTTAAFSSGPAPTTTQATDVLVGVVGIESGKSPTWASGWTRLPVLSVSSDFLDTAYQMATAAGSYAASGTASGEWMASIVTLKTS
jgi:fibronectin type 3 domain-containing protein